MPNAGLEPLTIELESSDLVLRGFTGTSYRWLRARAGLTRPRALAGEELEPAVLKGELVLNLAEATSLKEIQCVTRGLSLFLSVLTCVPPQTRLHWNVSCRGLARPARPLPRLALTLPRPCPQCK